MPRLCELRRVLADCAPDQARRPIHTSAGPGNRPEIRASTQLWRDLAWPLRGARHAPDRSAAGCCLPGRPATRNGLPRSPALGGPACVGGPPRRTRSNGSALAEEGKGSVFRKRCRPGTTPARPITPYDADPKMRSRRRRYSPGSAPPSSGSSALAAPVSAAAQSSALSAARAAGSTTVFSRSICRFWIAT